MKVLIVCIGDPFTENMKYKENYLIKACKEDGHKIYVIANTYKYQEQKVIQVEDGVGTIYGNVKLFRVKYDKIINEFVSLKIRKCSQVYSLIEKIAPDIIYYNTIQFYNILDLGKIKKCFPGIRIYGGVSTAFYNSAQNFLSLYLLHKLFYKRWLKKAEDYFDKIYYTVPESKEFFTKVYGIKTEKLEYSPLPCEVVSEKVREQYRGEIRKKFDLKDRNILFAHTGKMDALKKTTELLERFIANKDDRFRLIIAGAFDEQIKEKAMSLIESDSRIQYIGFLSGDELVKLLCAVDLYLQPGSPSHTAQTAMGCSCPVVVADMESYRPIFRGNGYMIKDCGELEDIFNEISQQPGRLKTMSKKSREVAEDMLDYKVLARRILNAI